ncbi:1-deoxy-D-xylulose-5-phosphate synthase [candidate division KSB3 bacterium]|uniref:1-deoxy-D-xylulose-5-phosphate synthase n=1 Tax=candidate division KSB3 bacterium TaxID=2044937 RepID=A0A2G6E1R7_9BACT|nr:MAG: 1-deoxy-D-xylulose-5-phosphate synthase [candidate division KSB3 bacterium]PIE28472.1 MAG: 1-deoxy-D-xylulose-5-phosphate synthase [candidate division KSB3 bacterium]
MTTQRIAMRDAFGEALVTLAPEIPELVVLDADVSSSTKTGLFGRQYPERFFNVGVAEANMIDIAAGMATCGLRPVVSAFALFIALKGADQIRNVVCYNTLPVVLAAGYAGLSDSYDGASHQSISDLAVMRALPNMTVVVPGDAVEVRQALKQALRRPGPSFIRMSRNPSPIVFAGAAELEIGKIRKIRDGADLSIAVCGVPTSFAVDAAGELAQQGIAVDLLEVSTLKPLDTDTLVASAQKTGRVLTVEEHNIYGGLGSAVAEALSSCCPVKVERIGVQDCFTESGPYDELLMKYGISTEAIIEKARNFVEQ